MASMPIYIAPAALITNHKGQYLFLQRSHHSKVNAGKWDMSGGKPEPGETLDQVLGREVREETGLHITRVGTLSGTAELVVADKRIIYLIFECMADGEAITVSTEHEAYKWVDKSEILALDLAPQFRPFFETFTGKVS